jgi:hypothetical protein
MGSPFVRLACAGIEGRREREDTPDTFFSINSRKIFKTDELRVLNLKHAAQNLQSKEFTRKLFQNRDLCLDLRDPA